MLVARGVPEQRARRTALEGFGRPQTLAHLMRQANQTALWSEALLGGAPFALLAALLGLQLWRVPAVAAAASALVVAVTLYGLWLGRPRWFYPWAGVALLLPIFAGYIAFAVLRTEVPVVAAGAGTPYALAGIAGASLFFLPAWSSSPRACWSLCAGTGSMHRCCSRRSLSRWSGSSKSTGAAGC